MTNLAIREKMRVLHIISLDGKQLEQVLIPDSKVESYKKQILNNTMIDMGDRIIPRRRIHEFSPEKVDKPMVQWLLSLDEDIRSEAKAIIAERKRKHQRVSWPDHIKQILTDRWIIS